MADAVSLDQQIAQSLPPGLQGEIDSARLALAQRLAGVGDFAPRFATTDLHPPTAYYLDGSMRLFTRIETMLPNVSVTVTAFVMRHNGRVEEINVVHTGELDNATDDAIDELLDGYLLGVSVTSEDSACLYGTTFVTVGLARGNVGSFIAPRILIARYVSKFQFVSWPEFRPMNSIEGRGFIAQQIGSLVEINDQFIMPCENNQRWRIIAVRFRYVADATVISRTIRVRWSDGTNVHAVFGCSTLQTAGQTVNYQFVNQGGSQYFMGTNNAVIPIPEIWLRAGDRIESNVGSQQGGDTLDTIVMVYERWVERSEN